MSITAAPSYTITLPEDTPGAEKSGVFGFEFIQPNRNFSGTVTFRAGEQTATSDIVLQFGDTVVPEVEGYTITEDRVNDYEIVFGTPYLWSGNIWHVDYTARVLAP